MRILHTSDWHLGRSFGQHRLLEDQARFVDWLVEVVRAEGVDLVVIAGDLYDRSVPPAEAVELLSEALVRLRSAGPEVLAIAGNHDSAERVAAYDGLTDAAGVIIRGGYRRAADVTVRHAADGPVALVTVPFLDPLLAPATLRSSAEGRCTHEFVLRSTLDEARRRLAPGLRTVAVAHAFVTGAQPSSSERELAVGTAGMVSAQLFEGFHYVALGHLHQPQVVADDQRIRYSGSPLSYSFSETGPKGVEIVEMDRCGGIRVQTIEVPVGRPAVTLRGRFDELCARDLGSTVAAWIRVELTDPTPVVDAHRRLRDRFPHLVEIERIAPQLGPATRLSTGRVRRLDRAELVRTFWRDVTGEAAPDEVVTLLGDALAGEVHEAAA